jgi:hypothetical protein
VGGEVVLDQIAVMEPDIGEITAAVAWNSVVVAELQSPPRYKGLVEPA